jgi:hypothetical protein
VTACRHVVPGRRPARLAGCCLSTYLLHTDSSGTHQWRGALRTMMCSGARKHLGGIAQCVGCSVIPRVPQRRRSSGRTSQPLFFTAPIAMWMHCCCCQAVRKGCYNTQSVRQLLAALPRPVDSTPHVGKPIVSIAGDSRRSWRQLSVPAGSRRERRRVTQAAVPRPRHQVWLRHSTSKQCAGSLCGLWSRLREG